MKPFMLLPPIVPRDEPVFSQDEKGQWSVKWGCPLCGAPATQNVASDSLKDFLKMFKEFHPYQTLCAECVMHAAEKFEKTAKGSHYSV